MAELPNDGFESYFSEKLWEMVPAVYRHEDEIGENPGVLRAFIEIIAEQAAIVRRSHDRLWEDQFIELCQDWAIPYLGDLLATRLVSAMNLRRRRIDVAKTIYYRRRKGTLRVLEELIGDITGWEGRVVEQFKRLARTRHGLDPQPGPQAGRFSGTLPGGLVELRGPRAALLINSGFGEFYHTPDFRQHFGSKGRYNIPKLAYYLYRLRAYPIEGVTPFPLSDGLRFTCNPSGRDAPLFASRRRSENWDDWRSPEEWALPAPISCHLLGHSEYTVNEALVQNLEKNFGITPTAAEKLRGLHGVRFPSDARLNEIIASLNEPTLTTAAVREEFLTRSLTPDCGKAALLSGAISVEEGPDTPVAPVDIVAGDLSRWPISNLKKRLVIDPERGRLQFFGTPPDPRSSVTHQYGFSGDIGAGTYSRPEVEMRKPTVAPNIKLENSAGTIPAERVANKGVTQIDDSRTYRGIGDKLKVQDLTLQAASQRRPYIRLTSNWVLNTQAHEDAKLMIDGIWLGSEGNFAVVLRGDYEEAIIRHASFDPGGSLDVNNDPVRPVPLLIEAQVETLIIGASIMGVIATKGNGRVENLVIKDSILDATDPSQIALQLTQGEVKLNRVTVFGRANVNRLWASEALITGVVGTTDTQIGCFRFSAAPDGSRLPRQYEAFKLGDAAHVFVSRCFGQPGYGQLSETAPEELYRGGENGSEIGAYNKFNNPIKLDSLKQKVEEYMPFGLIPIFIHET